MKVLSAPTQVKIDDPLKFADQNVYLCDTKEPGENNIEFQRLADHPVDSLVNRVGDH